MTPALVTHLLDHDWITVRSFKADFDEPRPMVVHDHAQIVLYLGGRARFWLSGSYTLGAGDVMLIPAGSPHAALSAEAAPALGVSLCLTCVSRLAHDALKGLFDAVHSGASACRRLTDAGGDRVRGIFEALDAELSSHRPGRALMLDALVSTLAVELMRAGEAAPTRDSRGANLLTSQALEFIQRRATLGISLRDVAKYVARSPTHLAETVKLETGKTVGDWIALTRMRAARQLLLHSDETIETLADRCGFASASHFHRLFKRMHDSTPGRWRQRHRGVRQTGA